MTEAPDHIFLLPKDVALFGQKYGHPDVQQVHVGDESVQYVRKDVADLARPVTVAEGKREYFVAAIADQPGKLGYRMRRVWASDTDSAIGIAVRELRDGEPNCTFSEFSALVATEKTVTVAEAAKVLLGCDDLGRRTDVYDACENRVKVHKFDAVLRALSHEGGE